MDIAHFDHLTMDIVHFETTKFNFGHGNSTIRKYNWTYHIMKLPKLFLIFWLLFYFLLIIYVSINPIHNPYSQSKGEGRQFTPKQIHILVIS